MSGVKMTVMRVYNIDAYCQPQSRTTAGAVTGHFRAVKTVKKLL
ncbi:hypothetical protein SEEGA711_17000 [Salmonella enterica subsp. enterica serovar Gaminara str. ATCC BAA-711]|nr:hypothetical protein SEEGA711_17000 [Salmonella enterica subsp. enterica serovar Gaminara str. ATCC BAA-711]